MAKRKTFEKVEMTLPFSATHCDGQGSFQPPKELIPPSVTKIEFGRTQAGIRSFDFKDYYGHGIDDVTFAFQVQVGRFVAGEDRTLEPTSILSLCANGVAAFLDYLIARSTAERREISVGDISRDLIDGFIGWLRDSGWRLYTQQNKYSHIKTVLESLGKRGRVQIVDSGDDRTFPKNPFPGSSRNRKGERPLIKAHRQALAKALREAVLPIFHPEAKPDSYLLTAALLLIALHTGRNLTPLLEMKPDCLRPHPKAGVLFLVLFKRRGHKTHKVALRDEKRDHVVSDIELTPTVRPNVAALIRRIIDLTEPLRTEASEDLRERVFLFRAKRSSNATEIGAVTCLSETTLRVNIKKLMAAHGLTDSEGEPLRLNFSQLRKTFINRIFEILDGDVVTTAIAAGHSTVATTDTNYLRPGENAEKNWKFMGQVLTEELLSGSIEKTPLAGCSNPRDGQYAPKRDGETCTNFLNCLRCRNYVVTGDDLYKLFSFEIRILKERNRMDKKKWKRHFGHIPRLIERDVIRPGIEHKKFKAAEVEAARERASVDLHPFWKTDSLIADLEALA